MTISKTNFVLPTAVHQLCLSWLTHDEIIKTERVSKVWRSNRPNEKFWIAQCLKQNIPQDSTTALTYARISLMGSCFVEEGVDPRDSSTCWKVARLIGEYIPEFMEGCANKVRAAILTARMQFQPKHEIRMSTKERKMRNFNTWDEVEDEPMCLMAFTPETNEKFNTWIDRAFHLIHPEVTKGVRDWSSVDKLHMTIPLPWALAEMSLEMPLRCFFDRNGNYKNDGDPIFVTYRNRKVILLCENSFEDSLIQRIEYSSQFSLFEPLGLQSQDIERQKALAKQHPKWIPIS